MADADVADPDLASAYEALIEFLYLAPVGIIKFRPDGTIDMANPTAAQLLMPLAADGDMSDLYRLLHELAPDLRAHVEGYRQPAGQIYDQMQLSIPSTRRTLMLDINKIDAQTLMAVVQNITDLTEARREVMRKTESQRLLASVFMRLNTPVAVIRADGFILLTNSAFQSLLGYDAKSLVGLNIDAVLPPECTDTARAARAQQMLDGASYEVEMEVVSKSGARCLVTMNSSMLREADKQLRVITLITKGNLANPAVIGALGFGTESPVYDRAVSQVRTIELASFKKAVGTDWPYISSRAMMLAEEVVKSLLGPSDILKRGKDDTLMLWFADGNAERNAALLTRATQGVRRVFMTEFGTKVAERVRSTVPA